MNTPKNKVNIVTPRKYPIKNNLQKDLYRRIENAEGYVLIAVYLFIYLYAC